MTDPQDIPPLFWQGMNFQEFKGIMDRNGLLTRAQTMRVWQMLGKRGPPPNGRMRVVVDIADFDKWLEKEFPTRH